jgi:hypothetical protein
MTYHRYGRNPLNYVNVPLLSLPVPVSTRALVPYNSSNDEDDEVDQNEDHYNYESCREKK